jgi:hypothetical protein
MKLEFKYVAGYLPYELNILNNGNIDCIKSIHPYGYFIKTVGKSKINIDKTILILRPLSDLTKEIENELTYNDLLKSEFDYNGINGFDFYYLQETPLEYPFNVIQKLLEWHFDIYGLIENNLAIDINTL